MFFHNFFNNIQSQLAAFVSVFCGNEPLQDSRQHLRGNPLAAIRDGQEQDRIFIYSNSKSFVNFLLPPQGIGEGWGGVKNLRLLQGLLYHPYC